MIKMLAFRVKLACAVVILLAFCDIVGAQWSERSENGLLIIGGWLFDGTGIGYGDLLGAAGTTVGYECDGCDFDYRDGLPYATGVDGTPENFIILATVPAAHFTRDTSARPPPPDQPSEVEYIAGRAIGGGRTPADVERFSHGHAVFGTYTSDAGGVVVTSGSTDWAHGLAGLDPPVEQITRNLLNRLSVR